MNSLVSLSRRVVAACLLGGVAMVHDGAAAQPLPKRELRGAWISTVTNIDWPPSPGGTPQSQQVALIAILDQLQAEGFNTVVFQIRPECDALYASPYEPWSYVLTGQQGVNPGYDPLAFAIQEAHKRGMELHAWFNPYRAVRDTTYYPVAPTHVSVLHPDWILKIGKLKMLDPGKQVVRAYVVSVIADVVRRYDIDAVHMDDYFYAEGITNQDSVTFATERRGYLATQLGDWRRDNVNLLIRAINDTVHAIKPWIKFGMSPRGIWKNGVPPGTTGGDTYSTIYCDATYWLTTRIVDYLAPQLYWKFGGSQDYALLQPWWASQMNGRQLYPGLATYRIGTTSFGDASQITRQIRFNRDSGNAPGEIQFTANYLTSNIGGIGDSLKNSLYRYPSLVPVMPWRDTIAPYPVRAIQFAFDQTSRQLELQWDTPIVPAGQDSSVRYALYGFDHYPTRGELDSTQYLKAITNATSIIPPVPNSTQGRSYYLVTALDHNWNESDTSNIAVAFAPSSPTLLSPGEGIQVPDSVRYVWRNPGDASQYRLQIGTDSTFSGGVFLDLGNLTDTTIMIRGLKGETRYFWRVQGGNAGGWGGYSQPQSVFTWQPAGPRLEFPADAQTGVLPQIDLVWRKSAVATAYEVQLARNQDFSLMVFDSTGITDSVCATPQLNSYTIYFWRVRGMNAMSTGDWSAAYRFRTMVVSSVGKRDGLPQEYNLYQNYPNPFNPSTTIRFDLPRQTRVRLTVYDILGREVTLLVDDILPGGYHSVVWQAHVASGVYFVRLQAGGYASTKQMILLK